MYCFVGQEPLGLKGLSRLTGVQIPGLVEHWPNDAANRRRVAFNEANLCISCLA